MGVKALELYCVFVCVCACFFVYIYICKYVNVLISTQHLLMSVLQTHPIIADAFSGHSTHAYAKGLYETRETLATEERLRFTRENIRQNNMDLEILHNATKSDVEENRAEFRNQVLSAEIRHREVTNHHRLTQRTTR